METQNASIEIAREKGLLSNISLSFPIWISTNLDKSVDIEMPFLGLSTSSQDEDEIDIAIEEAIKAFCIICDKYGQGLEKELESLGWESSQNRNNVYNIISNSDAIDLVLKTGHQTVYSIPI